MRHILLPGTHSTFIPGNQVRLIHNGEAYFAAIESAFDQAKYEIFLETYIFNNDAVGTRIADALIRATLRGVKVFVLIDGYGSKDLPQSVLDQLRTKGVKTLVFRPNISPWTLQRKQLRRMHRKIVVVDREIAFVGGINIIGEGDRDKASNSAPRFDFAVSVRGPLVDKIHFSTQKLWSLVAWSSLKTTAFRSIKVPIPSSKEGSVNASFLIRDNFRHRRDIENAYLHAIRMAKEEIILAQAYFLPGLEFRHALIDASKRGVRVVLMLQGKVEFPIERFASRALYGSFLEAGIQIHEYHKSILHAKVAVIDGHWATVGSSNIDPFSLLLSREANVIIDDEAFAETLNTILKCAMEVDSQQILKDKWKLQPLGIRIKCWLSYILLRLLKGVSGYSRIDNIEQK